MQYSFAHHMRYRGMSAIGVRLHLESIGDWLCLFIEMKATQRSQQVGRQNLDRDIRVVR